MNVNKLTATICALGGFAVGVIFVSPAFAQHEEHQGGHGHKYTGGSLRLHELMEESSKGMMQLDMSGNTDKDFAMTMAEHHEVAIKMADIELKHGKVAVLKAMAKKMKAAQIKERAELLKHAKMKH